MKIKQSTALAMIAIMNEEQKRKKELEVKEKILKELEKLNENLNKLDETN